jgi:membrane protease YdiL (CAAX protease family)
VTERNLLKRWPVASYYILVFVISWGSALVLQLGDFLRGVQPGLPDVLPTVVIMLAAPLLVGLTMTAITQGKDGLRDLLRRFLKWRVSGRWYLALLIFPVLILAVQIPLSIWFNPSLAPIFNPIGILSGVMAGLQEETGWMGFAYPRMRARFSVLRTAIILGLIHALWHVLADLLGNFNTMQEQWLPYFAGFFVFVVALRVIIVWIYENTQSLLMAMLAHAFSTGFLGILVTTADPGAIWPVFYAVYAVALWLVAALIIARFRKA